MMGWGDGGFWPFGMIIWLVIIIAAIAFVSWAVSARSSRVRNEGRSGSAGLDLLEQRYARGEIGRDEYLQKKNDILGR
jgi:putative membrane protein